ncbi:MAG: FAD:protein FMN transferase [Prevotella sp.]|jgi:thiamine biosynthesis lipoprotein|nr:FAD:protein FMN transferase [Prevotella sp.]MCH4182005.1 FAD:protein FMN transferase [Prevotella sp.]MCH4211839.1 FAD:protein FMN transferase [Prevotella sp.]MCH4240967.1 FAD:protein FMN transferase [Prevotella sp.]
MNKRNRKRLRWQIPFLFLLIIGTVYIIRQQRSQPYQKDTGFIFGTVYHITYQNDKDLQTGIDEALHEVDASLSPFNPQSIITQVNQNKTVKLNKMFTDVFSLAEEVSSETDGAFDITVAPLVNTWGFGFKKGKAPAPAIVDSLKSFVGFNKVKLINGKIVKQDPRVMLDCSGIAKGYGCDVVADFLRKNGIKNFIVEIGGEIVANGIDQKRVPWHIGVTKPTDDSLNTNQEIETILNVTDIAMATSGNYRNFYYKGGRKFAHTIDPHTGYPVQHSLLSSTVLAKNCATADAYATAFMVLGVNGAKAILRKHPELMVYFIYADDKGKLKEWYSPGLKDKIADDQLNTVQKQHHGRTKSL